MTKAVTPEMILIECRKQHAILHEAIERNVRMVGYRKAVNIGYAWLKDKQNRAMLRALLQASEEWFCEDDGIAALAYALSAFGLIEKLKPVEFRKYTRRMLCPNYDLENVLNEISKRQTAARSFANVEVKPYKGKRRERTNYSWVIIG